MKNKILNLIALVAMAICFSTFTLAKTTNLPADQADSINIFQTENTPTVTPAQTGTNLTDTVGMNTDLQNKFSVADVGTNGTDDADGSILTGNHFDGGTFIELNEIERIGRLNTEPDNLYLSSARATNFRPPNTNYQSPDKRLLKPTFDAVNRYTIRK